MSNITPSKNIMDTSQPKAARAPKRVAKKEATATPVAASSPVNVVEVASPVVASHAAAIPVAQPVASSSENQPTTTLFEDFESLSKQVQEWRESATTLLRGFQRLQKRAAKELKDAGRRKKRRTENGENREKRPTIFTTPVSLKDELCTWLEKPKGTLMAPADVTRAFSAYVEKHKLKDSAGHAIRPDASMRRVLGLGDGDTLTYRNIQTYLYKLYNLPQRKTASR